MLNRCTMRKCGPALFNSASSTRRNSTESTTTDRLSTGGRHLGQHWRYWKTSSLEGKNSAAHWHEYRTLPPIARIGLSAQISEAKARWIGPYRLAGELSVKFDVRPAEVCRHLQLRSRVTDAYVDGLLERSVFDDRQKSLLMERRGIEDKLVN